MNGFIDRSKGIGVCVSWLYLSLYVPIALMTYFPAWYHWNCHWHERCDEIGSAKATGGINDLTAFFRYAGNLRSFTTEKEKLHLGEVRSIFGVLLPVAVAAVLLLFLAANRRNLARGALISLLIVTIAWLIVPFFIPFWRDIFHPLLFDNELWRIDRADLSYYIMPTSFFRRTVIAVIALSSLVNGYTWLWLRRKRPEM